jgi:hypothetical protein
MPITRTRTGQKTYKRGKGFTAPEEWQLEWYDRVPKVTRVTPKGAAASVDVKAAGLNTPQPGTGGSKSANPKGRRIT